MTPTEEIQLEIKALKTEVKELKEIVTGQQSEKYYTVAQVATKLGISSAGVNFHIRKGNLKSIGNKQRFKKISESELNNYIASLTKN